jgi:hypothetical protein
MLHSAPLAKAPAVAAALLKQQPLQKTHCLQPQQQRQQQQRCRPLRQH